MQVKDIKNWSGVSDNPNNSPVIVSELLLGSKTRKNVTLYVPNYTEFCKLINGYSKNAHDDYLDIAVDLEEFSRTGQYFLAFDGTHFQFLTLEDIEDTGFSFVTDDYNCPYVFAEWVTADIAYGFTEKLNKLLRGV